MTQAVHQRVDKAQLREVNQLLKDVEIIEYNCLGSVGRNDEESKLDDFQRTKQDLNTTLTTLKQDIKTKTGIEERIGADAESIKLKMKITKNFEKAKQLQTRLEAAYDQNQRDLDNDEDETITKNEIKTRQELVSLMAQDLEYTQNEFEPQTDGVPDTISFRLSHRVKERRKQQREQGLISSKPQPLTAKQQAFIQESIQRDHALDGKLTEIKQRVIVLGQMAHDINHELEVQGDMLDEVEVKMDDIVERLEKRNEQIETLLRGGAPRWCPVLILCVILMACIGYIYSAFLS
eukprot:459407_1